MPNGNDLKGVEPDPEPVYDEPRMVSLHFLTQKSLPNKHFFHWKNVQTPDLENCDAIIITQFVKRFAWLKGNFGSIAYDSWIAHIMRIVKWYI